MKLARLLTALVVLVSVGLLMGCEGQEKGCCGTPGAAGCCPKAEAGCERAALASDTQTDGQTAGCSTPKCEAKAAGEATASGCAGKDPAKCPKSCESAQLTSGTADSSGGCPKSSATAAKSGCHSKSKAASVQADASAE